MIMLMTNFKLHISQQLQETQQFSNLSIHSWRRLDKNQKLIKCWSTELDNQRLN